MISKLLIFLCFLIGIFSLDLYVVPFNTRGCTYNFYTPCTGSSTNPFDDLYTSFKAGVLLAQAYNDMNLNFFLTGNNQSPGHVISNYFYTALDVNGSPFEKYQGLLNIPLYFFNFFFSKEKFQFKAFPLALTHIFI